MISANQLTFFRIISVPVFLLLVFSGRFGTALLIFLIAGATDLLDGLIARIFRQKTALGTLLDPLADKLLILSSFIVLSIDNLGLTVQIPVWITVVVIIRDLLLGVGALVLRVALNYKIFPPSILGKVSTLVQFITIAVVLAVNYFAWQIPVLETLFFLNVALAVLSSLHYLVHALKIFAYNRG